MRRPLLLALVLGLAAGVPAQGGGKPAVVGKKPAAAGKDAAQEPAVDPALGLELTEFAQWLEQYKTGAIRLMKEGKTDDAAIAALDERMGKLAKWNTLPAAKLLFAAAGVDPRPTGAPSPVEVIDFQRELMPFRVQSLANKHLRSMTGEGVLPWLLGMLQAQGVRAAKKTQEQHDAAVVLRVLGGHPSLEAQLELLKACHSMPPELRVVAVNAMARDAQLELTPTLLDLLKDPEPNVRVAAANALGTALQPHVDETLGKHPEGTTLQLRDTAIARLGELLQKDAIWQVRSAAAFALASMKCKPVVPVLIAGLDAELARKKDPWAMDVRLHKILEGLTGQKVLRGNVQLWKDYWAKEGAALVVRAKPADGVDKPLPGGSRYEKFFDMEIESDRVLFVVDFSGSMAEPVQRKATGGTGVAGAAAATTTKAQLVTQELKKVVMSLPDGALINLIVFSDTVRAWRQEAGRPALVKLDDEARDDLLGNFIDSLRPNGTTNLYDALSMALDFGGRGVYDKYYAAGYDTLYVITDGAPTAGAVQDKDEIRRRVREQNQLRKITIHCITFGDKNDTDFLRPLAEENGGRHLHVE